MKTRSKLVVVFAIAVGALAFHVLDEVTDPPDEVAVAATPARVRTVPVVDDVTPASARVDPRREVAPWDVKPSDPLPPPHHIPAWTLAPPRPDRDTKAPPLPPDPVPAAPDDSTIDGTRPPRDL